MSLVEKFIPLFATQQALIESELGEGGNSITQIAKHKTETVGLIINNRQSVRTIKNGRAEISGVKVEPHGTYPKYKAYQHVEPVDQRPFVCGTSSTTASRYTILVGSGGIEIKTIGVLNLSSEITTIVGNGELNLSSQHSVNIRGKCIVIGSSEDGEDNAVVIRNSDQVVIDSNLGVSRNIIVGGGATIEGNLCVRSVSAPVEIQETELTEVYGETVPGQIIGWCFVAGVPTPVYGGTIAGPAIPNTILVYQHSHPFKNLPLKLHESIIGIAGPDYNEPQEIVPHNPTGFGNKTIIPTATV